MKILRFLSIAFALCLCTSAGAQNVNASQQVVLQGLRTAGSQGSFVAASFDSSGNLFLLLDEHDGIRVLKTDSTGSTVLAQVYMGATGDDPIAMSLDPSGNLYVTGTTTSGTLTGTSGTPFPTVADTTTNSFLVKYDTNLNLLFLTFLGAGKTAAASVYTTSDAAFVAGITFSTTFPVTPGGIQQTPSVGSTENGFVERISSTGSTLVYATYLTGANGNTVPTAIVADTSDNAYIAGSTSASGLPTLSALQPVIMGTNSGFLAKLNTTGSAFVFSSFIAGNGITSMALDSSSNTLLLSGNVAIGQFPIATVAMPLTSASYQMLLRIPVDGQSLSSSILLVPGIQSFVSVGPNQTAWISGALSSPLFPGDVMPDYSLGDSFLLHLTASNVIDQTLRFGGAAVNNSSYASLASLVAAPAVSVDGATAMLPAKITATVSSSLLATQRFDLPLVAAPNTPLPNTLRDVIPTASLCGSSSQCSGTGAMLTSISTLPTTTISLSVSSDDLPNLTLRNLGSNIATGLSLSVSGYMIATNCGTTLEPSNQCSIALTGPGPGTLTVSAANATTSAVTLAANTLSPDAIVLSTEELDFGITDSADGTATQTVTVTNLSSTSQTFSSAKDSGTTGAATFAETGSDCASGGATGLHILAANSSCHITLGLTVSGSSTNDGAIHATWKIGNRDIVLTAYAQAAALNVSATEVDFGTQFSGSTALNLPRYLYLSNNSNTAIAHNAASLPSGSPFSVVDGCSSTLEPNSVCPLKLTYLSNIAPSSDTSTLNLDEGISVLITGETLPPASATGSAVNPNLSVSTASVTFSTAIPVTTISSTLQDVTVKNTGSSSFSLSFAISGDFTVVNGCPSTLTGGASCIVQVGFAPSQPGLRDGLLSITAGSGFTPSYVSLSGTGSAILPANNGTLSLGQTLEGEPLIVWYKIQQALTTLTAMTGSPEFGVALVQDTGSGHGSLPISAFSQTATASCSNCWLGVQFLSQTAGTLNESLTLSSVTGGNPYALTVVATALPVQGLLLTPITQDFGPVAINSTSAPMLFTLANLLTASASVTIQSVVVTGDFTLAVNNSGGASCTGLLVSTASCFVQVVFSPTAVGNRSGTLMVTTSAGTASSILTGYGSADPGLGINPTSLSFSNIPGPAAIEQSITLTNTGSSSLIVGSPSSSDPSFSATSNCSTLAAGAQCSLLVIFTPQAATVAATLSIPVTSTLNGQTTVTPYMVPLSGNYTSTDAGLQILPNSVNFGSEPTGSFGQTREFTLNNLSGKTVNVTLAMPRQFPLASSTTCPTLSPGASCSFSVSFLPITGGALTGTIYAEGVPTDHSASVQALAYMLGYGAASGNLSISGGSIPYSPIGFGQVTSGQSASQTLTLTNSGTGALTIHRITSQPPFFSTSNCGAILAANQSCSVTLTYSPIYEIATGSTSYARNDTGTLTIESDAITSPDSVTLSGSVEPIVSSNPANSAVLASFSLSESSLTFANTQIGGASTAQAVTLTNTGTTTIHVLSTMTSVDFTSTNTCTTLLPGATCSLTLQFTPTNGPSSLRTGTLSILSDAATSLEFISLIGTTSASPLTITPSSLNFGTVNVGSSDTLSVSITNNAVAPVMFVGVATTGDYASSRGSCPANGSTLAAGSTCSLSVTFTPMAAGTRTGTLSLTNDATQLPLTVSLTGNAVQAQLQVTPGALAFGGIDVTYPATLTLTLLNIGSASVTGISNAVSGISVGDFVVTAPCSTTTLAPNQGCTETLTFTPSAMGLRMASLSIGSSDPNGPAVIALSGTGIQAGTFVLTVNGGSSATATVTSGQPAVYDLLATPTNGFAGNVALTCAPIVAAQYASCSLLSSTLSLSGGTQYSTATITTVTGKRLPGGVGLAALLLLPLAWMKRRKAFKYPAVLSLILLMLAGVIGCGGSSESKPALLYAPIGTYQYQVTASSTSGAPISSTVTLNLIVQ
jgi:hypothetical protein